MSKKRRGLDIRQFFGTTPKKLKTNINNVFKQERAQCVLGMDTSRRKTKSFIFCYNKNNYKVTCDTSMTIQEALHTNDSFKAISEKNQQKEIIINRQKPPVATVTPDFPICLIDENETLNIDFKSVGTEKKTPLDPALMTERENFVSFNISKRGGANIRKVLKHNDLTETSYVCVYAVKGETVEAALSRDGRFRKEIFQKGILCEESSKTTINLSNPVEGNMDGKNLQIIINPNHKEAQKSTPKKHNDPETPQAANLNGESVSAEKKKTETAQKEKKSRRYPKTKKIPETEEILELLREQHSDLRKTLKDRENLKNNGEMKRFFRVEYDKSVQSFSEVKTIRKLMKLSDSVCQIRTDGTAVGTGFLLFDRFVLTNAHVVGEFDPFTREMMNNLTAVFGFEDFNSGEKIAVEQNLVAFFHGKDNEGNHLDFALLELSSDVLDLPELLRCYSTPPSRGGVCIIGHPGGGVKQIDPCFIIAKEDILQEAERYSSNNKNHQVFHVITKQCLAEDREIHKSQIMYNSCFFHGSSGSPVFDEHCKLIGVHTGGYVYPGQSRKTRSVMEYSLSLFPALVQIFRQCRERGRSDIVQYFRSQNNLKYVLKVANKQLQRNH